MRLFLSLLLLLTLTRAAAEVPANLDAYMFINGRIAVTDTGRVSQHSLDTEVDAPVRELVDRVVSQWLFEPVKIDGQPVHFTTNMRATLHGRTQADGMMKVRIEDVVFTGSKRDGSGNPEHDMAIRYRKTVPPQYPYGALRTRTQGQTMIALRINREGKVIDKAVMYTDLVGVSESEKTLATARGLFEKSALRVVGHWKFALAANAIPEGKDDITVQVPIAYTMSTDGWVKPGQWSILTRGPRQRISWLDDGELAAQFPEGGDGASWPVKLMTQPDGSPL